MIIVYAPILRNLKSIFQYELKHVRDSNFDMGIICGDFNAIRHISERSGPSFDVTISQQFNTFVNQNHLIEHKLQTIKYTWCRQFALLDRFFTTIAQDQLYKDSVILEVSCNGYDHYPFYYKLPLILLHINLNLDLILVRWNKRSLYHY